MKQTDSNPSALALEYNEALNRLKLNFSRVAAMLAIVFVPAGTILDWFTYPGHWADFLTLRFGASVVILFASIAYYRPGAERYSGMVTFGWLNVIQLMIAFMIYRTDGALSPYYAGLTLTLFAAAIVLPLSFREIVALCFATLGLYLFACVANAESLAEPAFGANLFFVVVTCVITATAVYYNERRRVREFVLSRDLGAKYRELTELDRLKDLFVANISHELRTPLTVILAPVKELLARSAEVPAWVADRLGIVEQNAERLLAQVNDLLDVLRLEADRLQLTLRPLDLVPLVRQQLLSMAPWADSREVALVDELGQDRRVFSGDGDAVIKVVQNLLSNAIKFSEPGDTVRVRVRSENGSLVLEVEDTGVGIPADEVEAIFDRFHQVDQSATRKHKGSGIGLALVKELTEAMAGEVSVSSDEGRGTTMCLHFPALQAEGGLATARDVAVAGETSAAADDGMGEGDDDGRAVDTGLNGEGVAGVHAGAGAGSDEARPIDVATAAAAVPRSASGIVDIDTEGERPLMLVVEDEQAISDYLATLFADRFEVIQAGDGRGGLALALERQPALMLLDFMLPELDGLEVCRTLKAHPRRGPTKVLMLTARTDEEVKLQALDYGADDFLTKPFSPAEVRTRVRNLLKTQALEQRVHARNDELSKALDHLQATQQQLLQSEKLNALGQLSAGLLHEVNNPLNYTVTALSLAKGLPSVHGDEMLADIIADIDEGMQRISTIVSDLRAFAYPSDAARHHPFGVRAAVDKALRFTSHETRDFTIEVDVADDLEAEGSESHIVQVLVNLVTNAVKAIAARGTGGPGRIGIEAMRGGGRLSITVGDNGIGMDEATLNQCLNPFFTTREVGSGMGMGLSICNTIIGEHGGTLKVDSHVGQGTTVAFDLRDFGAGVAIGEAGLNVGVDADTYSDPDHDSDTAGTRS